MTLITRNSLLGLIATLSSCAINAQSFKNTAAIEQVMGSGFYAIRVTPALSSYIKADFSDLRIIDEKGNPVPYILKSDLKKSVSFTDNPPSRFRQIDSSDHISYITVYNPAPFHINTIRLQMKGGKFFKREATISSSRQTPAHITLSSDTTPQFYVSAFRDSSWFIKIYNGDNPPLTLTGLSTAQNAEKIITYLEIGKKYHLEVNNDSAVAPSYDLQDFKDSIPTQVVEVKLGNIEPAVVVSSVANKTILNKTILWAIIIFILILLLAFTRRLTKEIGRK